MEARKMTDYPTPLTPEHDKRGSAHHGMGRNSDEPLHEEVVAAYDYVDSVIDTSDFMNPPAWHGWAIREAFLAGISYAKRGDENRPHCDREGAD